MRRYLIPLLLFAPLVAHAQVISTGRASCAILTSGTIKCWGQNVYGQLGLGDTSNRGDAAGEMGDNLPAVDLGTGRTATAVASSYTNTCALLDNGSVKCWGYNNTGQLGLGDIDWRGDAPDEMGDNLPTVDLGTNRAATTIATGTHTCAVLDNGAVKCWGQNHDGQLGLGDRNHRGDQPDEMGNNLDAVDLGTGRTATAIVTGAHTCALLDNGTVKCWGFNSGGQLGLGDNSDRGDQPGEMGDNLPVVDLGTGRTATAIASGSGSTCAILDNGSVKCWGDNSNGQLGLGDTNHRGDQPDEMGDNLAAIDLGTGRTATAIATGESHTCALLDNGSVKCWGYNDGGQLGLSDASTRGNQPGQMGDALPTVDLGTGRTATAIASGHRSTCAVLDNGSVKCWGYNSSGQLGLGDTSNRGGAAGEMGDNLPAIDLSGIVLPVEATIPTSDASLALYGNPAHDVIHGTLMLPQSEGRLTLYDMLGREVARQDVVAGAFTLDVRALPSGLYLLRVEADAGTITRAVVVAR